MHGCLLCAQGWALRGSTYYLVTVTIQIRGEGQPNLAPFTLMFSTLFSIDRIMELTCWKSLHGFPVSRIKSRLITLFHTVLYDHASASPVSALVRIIDWHSFSLSHLFALLFPIIGLYTYLSSIWSTHTDHTHTPSLSPFHSSDFNLNITSWRNFPWNSYVK